MIIVARFIQYNYVCLFSVSLFIFFRPPKSERIYFFLIVESKNVILFPLALNDNASSNQNKLNDCKKDVFEKLWSYLM